MDECRFSPATRLGLPVLNTDGTLTRGGRTVDVGEGRPAGGHQWLRSRSGAAAASWAATSSSAQRPTTSVRRGHQDADPPEPRVVTDAFTVDLAAQQATDPAGMPIRLTPTEWNILALLARNAGKLLPNKQLLTEVWGPVYEGETHYLRVYIAQLRRKLEPDPARPRHLRTEPGIGYRFTI